MISTQDAINTTLCILGHVQDAAPPKIKELAEFLSILPVEEGVPLLEVQSSIEVLHNKLIETQELTFRNAKIDGNYVRDVLFGHNVELRMKYDQAQQVVTYHPRLLIELHKQLGSAYYKAKIQQAIARDDTAKLEYFTTRLKNLTAQETAVFRSATQVANQYIMDQAMYGSGIITEIPQIDKMIDYLTYRSLNVFMAPSANFKTTTASSIAYSAAMSQGKHVVYFTLEDFDQIIWYNIIARHSFELGGKKIPASAMKKYKLSTAEEVALMQSVSADFDKKLTKGSFTVLSKHSCKDLTPAGIELKLREISNIIGADIDMVVIDHFNLLNMPIPSMPWLTGAELQRYYVTSLTNLSITMGKRGFVLLGLAQLNREGQGEFEGGQMASSLHVAGTIELLWSATNFIYLYADSTARASGLLKGKLIKSRFSSQGVEFVTNIQPAYCVVGKGADTTDPTTSPSPTTVGYVDPVKESAEARKQQLQQDALSGKVQASSLDELATLLTGMDVIENKQIVTAGKGTSDGVPLKEQ